MSACNGKRRILITGATGLIGAALADYIAGTQDGASLYVAVRNPSKANKRFGDIAVCVPYDATKPLSFDFGADLVVHCASAASPELFVSAPVETLMANIYGIRELLEYARRVHAKKTVYVSSSEVYARCRPGADGFTETCCGSFDPLNVRASYPIGKLAAEALCAAYAKEYGMNVSIVRPGHIYGPTASPSDRRVSSAFAWSAARGEPIVLKSSGMSLRSYTHCEDCASAIMAVAETGLPGEAYNIANRDGNCTIRDMAEIMADAGGVDLMFQDASGRERAAFNPMEDSRLDPAKLESLGWRGRIGFKEGFRQTVAALRTMSGFGQTKEK